MRLQTSLFIGGKKSKANQVSETVEGKGGDVVIVGTPGRLRQELFSGDANGKFIKSEGIISMSQDITEGALFV